MNKFISAIIISFFGIITVIIGALFKILHWPGGSFLLLIGVFLEFLAILVLIITLILKSKQK